MGQYFFTIDSLIIG